MPKSSSSAMAVPISSARSVAQIATSARAQSAKFTGRGKRSRQSCAKSRPVAMPTRAQRACSSMAISEDSSATESSV
jgi:hypothetical protein